MNDTVEAGPTREMIHARLERLKRGVFNGSMIAFGILFALSAQHIVIASHSSTAGTTPSTSVDGGSSQQQPQSQDSGGFFGGDGGGSITQGNGPVVGSGGS